MVLVSVRLREAITIEGYQTNSVLTTAKGWSFEASQYGIVGKNGPTRLLLPWPNVAVCVLGEEPVASDVNLLGPDHLVPEPAPGPVKQWAATNGCAECGFVAQDARGLAAHKRYKHPPTEASE